MNIFSLLSNGISRRPVFLLMSGLRNYSSTFLASDLTVEKSKTLKDIPPIEGTKFGRVISDHMIVVKWEAAEGWSKPTIIPYGPLPLHPSISALNYATTIFEGLKCYKNNDQITMFRPLDHFVRLKKSAARMCLPLFDEKELFECIKILIKLDQRWIPTEPNSSLYIRPTLFATDETIGISIPEKATLTVLLSRVGAYFKSGSLKPVSLYVDPVRARSVHGGCGNIKTGANYGPTIFVQREAEQKGCSQVLYLHEYKYITEAGTMNFFIVIKDQNNKMKLITPSCEDIILEGITRKSILEIAQGWPDMIVEERRVSIDEMIGYIENDQLLEAFGSGTACTISPVGEILYKDKRYKINFSNDSKTFSSRILAELKKYQTNSIKNNWAYVIN